MSTFLGRRARQRLPAAFCQKLRRCFVIGISNALSEATAHIVKSIDHDPAIRIDVLEDKEHGVLGYGDTAAGIGLQFADAVKEDGVSPAFDAFGIETDIETVLVLILIIDKMLAVLGVELRIL